MITSSFAPTLPPWSSIIKRIFALLLALVIVGAILPVARADNLDTIVYVTATGTKYHRDGCKYLKTRFEITLGDACAKGYTPCSHCDPPLPDGKLTVSTPAPTKKPSTNSASYSGSDTIVYVTATGTKYHRDGCRHLKTWFEMSLEDACAKGYTPCSTCKPPTLDISLATSTPKPSTAPSSRSSSGSSSIPASEYTTPSPRFSSAGSGEAKASTSTQLVPAEGKTNTGRDIIIAIVVLLGVIGLAKLKKYKEDERQRQAELEKQRIEREAELERQRKEREAEFERQRIEREAELEKQRKEREAKLEAARKRAEELERKKQAEIEERKRKEEERQAVLKELYTAEYGGKAYQNHITLPYDLYWGEDNRPHTKGPPEQSRYAFKLSARKVHRVDCPFYTSTKYVYASKLSSTKYGVYYKSKYYSGCMHCDPVLPDMSWYREYQNIMAIKKKYEID